MLENSNPTIYDFGFDGLLNKSPLFENTPESESVFTSQLSAGLIGSGEMIGNITMKDGLMKSDGFVTGVSGWQILPDGTVEFNNGYFRGIVSIGGATDFDSGYDPSVKVNTFAQAAVPTSIAAGDLWVDTDDNNKLYRAASAGADQITAGEWVLLNDLRAADAVLKAGTGQAISGNFNLNDTKVLIDGANNRIVINDGSNDRILIGKLAGKF